MKRYDIYLVQLGFHPVAVIGKLVYKYEWDSYIQKENKYTKQYTKTQNTQNRKHTEQEKKHKRIWKSESRVIRK